MVFRRPRKCKYRQAKGCFFFKKRSCCFCISVRVLFVGWPEQISQFVHRTVAEYWVWSSRIAQNQKTSPNVSKHLKIIGIPKSSRTCSNNKDGKILSDSRPKVKQSIDILQSVASTQHNFAALMGLIKLVNNQWCLSEYQLIRSAHVTMNFPIVEKLHDHKKLLFHRKQSATKFRKNFKQND